MLARGHLAFANNYQYFVDAFTKRFAPLDTTEAAWDVLKSLKQGKSSMVEYISKFDQFTSQTGWSNANHHTRFNDGLNENIKDNLAISDHTITTLKELYTASQILDQCMHQHQAEKSGKTLNNMTQQTPSKDPNAMEVDATCQSSQKDVCNRQTYIQFMRGKCYGCGSPDLTKKDGKHKWDICGHCKKVGHCSPICFTKYLGKPIVAKAVATEEAPGASSSTVAKGKAAVSTTSNALATDSKAQADLLAKLMVQVSAQSGELKALKLSF